MINRLIGGFVAILIGVSLIGPIATEVNTATASTANLTSVSSWGSTVLKLVPGFFALAIFIGAAFVMFKILQAEGVADGSI